MRGRALCATMLRLDTAVLRPWTHTTRDVFPGSFRAGIGTLLGQVSRQRGVPAAKIKLKSGEERDVDILQMHLVESGMIDCDWFARPTSTKRVRTWAEDDGHRHPTPGMDQGKKRKRGADGESSSSSSSGAAAMMAVDGEESAAGEARSSKKSRAS